MTSEPRRLGTDLQDAPDPLAVYRALTDQDPVLLEGRTDHPEARWSYVAFSPAMEARIEDGALAVRSGGEERRVPGPPLAGLRRLLHEHAYDVEEDHFTGGWAGVFAYEATGLFEPDLPMHAGPQVVLRLYRDVVAWDADTGRTTLWSTDLPGEHSASSRHAQALATIQTTSDGPSPAPVRIASWTPSMDEDAFTKAVRHVRGLVRQGDLFQANIATRFRTTTDASAIDLYAALRARNPGPFMALMDHGDHTIISTSPEQLFGVRDARIRSRPIAGTRPRASDAKDDDRAESELIGDAKEQAEHTMLVDLVRNDVAKVAVPGSVHVPEYGSVERYSRVMHLVSRVEADVRQGTGLLDWMDALFPGGTITGAPKHRACQRIHEAEPVARGPYTGSAGYLSWSGLSQWNILIRTLVKRGHTIDVHAGSGIVADSDPQREWEEAGHKARALLEMGMDGEAPGRIGEVSQHGAWAPENVEAVSDARVLLIDNYDSFVHNLADQCAALGASVQVIRNDDDWAGALAAFSPTHIILSPGPGRPEEAGDLLAVCRHVVGRLPVLGVCLGHQALAEAAGAQVLVGPAVHGKPATIRTQGSRILGAAGDRVVGRYHSLFVPAPPRGWRATAWLDDGTLMAMEHEEHQAFGVQFHPESLLTEAGHEILLRFLHTR